MVMWCDNDDDNDDGDMTMLIKKKKNGGWSIPLSSPVDDAMLNGAAVKKNQNPPALILQKEVAWSIKPKR